jgi:hypothetical protein
VRQKVLLSTAALALAAFLAACSARGVTPISSVSQPPIGPVTKVTSGADITLPLLAFEMNGEDAALIHSALLILSARCSLRFGVVSTDHTIADPAASRSDAPRLYGVVDLSVAENYGYHSPYAHAAGGVNDKQALGAWNPSAKERLVTLGLNPDGSALADPPRDSAGDPLPPGGCAGEAERTLAGGQIVDRTLPQELEIEASQRAESDSRVRAVWTTWSRCMATAGYTYESPNDPINSFGGSTVSAAEKATAVADVRCRLRTNMVGLWMAVETAYDNELIAQNTLQLQELQRRIDVQRANAKKLLSSG